MAQDWNRTSCPLSATLLEPSVPGEAESERDMERWFKLSYKFRGSRLAVDNKNASGSQLFRYTLSLLFQLFIWIHYPVRIRIIPTTTPAFMSTATPTFCRSISELAIWNYSSELVVVSTVPLDSVRDDLPASHFFLSRICFIQQLVCIRIHVQVELKYYTTIASDTLCL